MLDPAQAALEVARAAGLAADRADEVSAGTHVLVRLEPGGIAARVTGDGPLAQFAGDLDTEVRLAAALHAAGAPVVPPLPDVAARAHRCGGRRVTLWRWWDARAADGAQAIGHALAECHRVLGATDVPLRPWAKLAEARARLPEVDDEAQAVLAPFLEPPDTDLRPIHGDAHAGNVMPGPV